MNQDRAHVRTYGPCLFLYLWDQKRAKHCQDQSSLCGENPQFSKGMADSNTSITTWHWWEGGSVCQSYKISFWNVQSCLWCRISVMDDKCIPACQCWKCKYWLQMWYPLATSLRRKTHWKNHDFLRQSPYFFQYAEIYGDIQVERVDGDISGFFTVNQAESIHTKESNEVDPHESLHVDRRCHLSDINIVHICSHFGCRKGVELQLQFEGRGEYGSSSQAPLWKRDQMRAPTIWKATALRECTPW